MHKVHQKAAGADIGSEKIFISVDGHSVESFRTFTTDLGRAVQFLLDNEIKTIAMEATGVYWITFYDLVESAGIEAYLVNPSDTKNLPGRKTDVMDCQWIQQLHSYGLLRKSFIPDKQIRSLRVYLRLREDHIEMGSTHVQHIQKCLTQMNLRLHQVISQINGVSGRRVIEAILSGETDAERLATLCTDQILKKKKDEVVESLKGNYKPELIFALGHAYESYLFYQKKMRECDHQIEILLRDMSNQKMHYEKTTKAKPLRHNKPEIKDLSQKLLNIYSGNDGSLLPGISDYSVLKLLGEIGADLSAWPTEKHFTSWLGLAPGKNSSGKQTRRSKRKANTKAGQIFREAAQTILKSKRIALGSFARRLRAKKGPAIAIKATARKLAELFYRLLTKGLQYVELGVAKYEEKYHAQLKRFLYKKARSLNMQLIESEQIT